MAWGRQETIHYLSQCWPRVLTPYGVTLPQRYNNVILHIALSTGYKSDYELTKVIFPICRIYASMNWFSIGSGNGLAPNRRQAITWTNAGLLSIGFLKTNFSEIWIGILSFSFKEMHLKMFKREIACYNSSVILRPSWQDVGISISNALYINIMATKFFKK